VNALPMAPDRTDGERRGPFASALTGTGGGPRARGEGEGEGEGEAGLAGEKDTQDGPWSVAFPTQAGPLESEGGGAEEALSPSAAAGFVSSTCGGLCRVGCQCPPPRPPGHGRRPPPAGQWPMPCQPPCCLHGCDCALPMCPIVEPGSRRLPRWSCVTCRFLTVIGYCTTSLETSSRTNVQYSTT
jgi:hypothetical protein